MGWKDWDRTNKVIVSVCAVVVVAVIATFAVLALRPNQTTPPTPPSTPGTSRTSETPTPSPSPTYECTTASGSECTKDLAEKEAARDKAYADAEARYRQYHDERVKLLRSGGQYDGLPKVFNELTNKSTFDSLNVESFTMASEGWHAEGPTYLKNVSPAPTSPEWPSGKVLLQLCRDESSFNYLDDKGVLRGGGEKQAIYVQMEKKESGWIYTALFVLEESDLCG
ncbi:hypothetical protein ACQBAR_07305 [Propionibacteriaceae bacterium Y1685]